MSSSIMPDKIATATSYSTSGALVFGGSMSQVFSSIDWNLVAVLGGFFIGLATFLVNAYFQRKRTAAYERQTAAYEAALNRGVITSPQKGD